MNILVSSNDRYVFPLKVMLTSLLENNTYEHHYIYFLYNDVQKGKIENLCQYVKKYNATVIPYHIDAADFQEFPVSHHFSIETYYRFLAQDIIPKTEDRVLWLDADMIVKKSIKDFYNQDFEGKYLVVCRSINKNPQVLLKKLNCPPGTVYFNAGTILFNLNLVRNVTLADYHEYFADNKDRITWLDQDILNGMYALKTKIADYRLYNMQMFSEDIFSATEKQYIKESTAIVHYIGAVKPWQAAYKNPCAKYWIQYAKKVWTIQEYISFLRSRIANWYSQR